MHRFVFLYGSNNVFPTAQSEAMSRFLIPVFQQKTSITNTCFLSKTFPLPIKNNLTSDFYSSNKEIRLLSLAWQRESF